MAFGVLAPFVPFGSWVIAFLQHLIPGCEIIFLINTFVLSAMTAGAQRDQIIGFIRPQLAAMYEMMDVKIF